MTPVYSTRFIGEASFSGGPVYPFTVPDGFVAVVKCLSIVWGDVTISGLDAWFQDDSLAKLVRRTIQYPSSVPDYIGGDHVMFGTWTLDAGQQLGCQTAAGTADFWASGYLLTLP